LRRAEAQRKAIQYRQISRSIRPSTRHERLSRMSTTQPIFCPDCGAQNDADAKFCDNCGRALQDVRETFEAVDRVTVGDEKDAGGRVLADDRRPVGEDPYEEPGGERVLWEGRPSKLWSPRMALTQRYRLTSQRLIMTFGFIGRRTEEIDLY